MEVTQRWEKRMQWADMYAHTDTGLERHSQSFELNDRREVSQACLHIHYRDVL